MSQKFEYFGKYILLEKIASGGMAEVFLARALGAGGIAKFVAIKRILPQYSDNPEFISMFKEEAKIAVNLSHSNIVPIFEFGVNKGQFYLVMDYVEGRNVRQILNKMREAKSKFAIDQIIYMIKEVAGGLDHAHRCLDGTTGKPLNITHRDISPQNVMVSFEGEIKIVDFGIAKAESQLENTRAGVLKGKFGYMSPEQTEGHHLDLRTDIFSLGIVLWELLANERLFLANNEMNTLRKIRECQIPSLRKIDPNIHPELERIVQKALARDRNLRYQTAAALHRDLNRFLNRQYPDFSPQDFSVYIKTIYADEILATRKRLIEYSKVPFKKEASDDTIAIDVDSTEIANFSTSVSDSQTLTDSEVEFGDQFQNVASEFATNATMNIVPEGDDDEEELATVADYKAPSTTADRWPRKDPVPMATKSRLVTKVRQKRRLNVVPLAIVTLLSVGLYFIGQPLVPVFSELMFKLQNQRAARIDQASVEKEDSKVGPKSPNTEATHPTPNSETPVSEPKVPKQTVQTPKPKPPKPTPPAPKKPVRVVAPTSKPEKQPAPFTTRLSVNTTPSNAEIFINGVDTDQTTPAIIEVSGVHNFSVTLKKHGYLDYTLNNFSMMKHGKSSLNATLQKATVGYVDIDVRPPLPVVLWVNGEKLLEKPPVSRYTVNAGARQVIRAETVDGSQYAQRTIVVGKDKRIGVILKLKSKERQPSRVGK